MGLHPEWRPVLSPEEQAPLSPGLLPVGHDAKGDEVGCESVYRISARGNLNPGGLDLEWPS